MRPVDPAVRGALAVAKRPLALVLAGSVAQALCVIGQAFGLAGLIVALVGSDPLAGWAVVTLAATLGRAACGGLVDAAAAAAAGRVGTSLRHTLLRSLLAGPVRTDGDGDEPASPGAAGGAAPEAGSGAVATLATRGVAATEPYLTRYVPAAVLAGVLPVLTIVAIASQDWLSAVIVICTLPLVPVFAALVGWRTQAHAQKQWRLLSALSGHFVDVVRGLPTLVAYRRAHPQVQTIRSITHRYRRATVATLRLAFASSAVLELIATISVALVAVAVGLRLQAGSLDLFTALAVLLLAPEAYWPLRRMGAEFHAAAEGMTTFTAVREAVAQTPAAAAAHDVPAGGALAWSGLAMSYPGRTVPALADASGSVTRGELVAVSGPSGAGKSTLLSVLAGELPATGSLTVDGEPVEVTSEGWRRQVAYVPQRPWLFAGSIADNVRLGRADADDSDVWEALRVVKLDEVVRSRAGGIDAPVAEDGRGFSAGERARLTLARAVVSRRPVVLLDEPTAHLDEATEAIVLDTLRWLAARSAVLVVAHRPAVLAAADRVIEVDPPATAPAPGISQPSPATAPAAEPATSPVTATRSADAPNAEADADTRPEAAPGPDAGRPSGRERRRWPLAVLAGSLASASGAALTATAGWLIVRASEHPPVLYLMVAIVGVRMFGIARPVLRYCERLLSHDAALHELAEVRAGVFATLVPLTPGALGRRRGELLTSVVDDVDAHVDRRLRGVLPVITGAVVVGGAVLGVALVSPVASGYLGLLAVFCALVAWWTRRSVAGAEQTLVAARAEVTAEVLLMLDGRPDLRRWQAGDRFVRAADHAGDRVARAQARSGTAVGLGRALVVAGVGATCVAIAAALPDALGAGTLSAAVAALLVLLPLGLADSLGGWVDAAATRARTSAALARLAALERLSPAVSDPQQPRTLPADAETGAARIRTHRLTAGWDGVPAVADLEMSVGPGEVVAVSGPTGAGKTTVISTLVRAIDPISGAITLGDRDLRELRLDDVRRPIAHVDDRPHVFASTLVENVRLARPASTDAEVEHALRRARLGPWLDGLPHGLHTWLGDGASDVSGGERARIALARAILADQPYLMLDEPAAHLDAATAEAVLGDLLDASASRAVVLVSHRRVAAERVTGHVRVGAAGHVVGVERTACYA